MISKFIQEAESIQKTMRDWTKELKKIGSTDDSQEIRQKTFKSPLLDPLKPEQQENIALRIQNVQASSVKAASAQPSKTFEENINPGRFDQEDDDDSSSISSMSSSSSSSSSCVNR